MEAIYYSAYRNDIITIFLDRDRSLCLRYNGVAEDSYWDITSFKNSYIEYLISNEYQLIGYI